jgi:hypothetical protein
MALNNIVKKSANLVKASVSNRDDIDIVLRLAEAPNIFVSATDISNDIGQFIYFEVGRAITDGRFLHGQMSDHLKNRVIASSLMGPGECECSDRIACRLII